MEVNNGDSWERWKEGNSREFVVETKRFTQRLTAGFWVITEHHWSGIREISISGSHVNWLRERLKWKSANPVSVNRKVWRKIGDCTVAVFVKTNQWGKFISIVSNDPVKGNQFIIVLGGSAGNHWENFAGWIGLAFQGEVANRFRSSHGNIEETVVRGARRYANVVTGVSSLPGVSTFTRLECEIAELKIKIVELTNAVRHLVERDHQQRAVFGESCAPSSSGTTLVDNSINIPLEIAPDAIALIGEGETNLGDGICHANVPIFQNTDDEADSLHSMEENCDEPVIVFNGGSSAEKMTVRNHLPDISAVSAHDRMRISKESNCFPQNHVTEEIVSGTIDKAGYDVLASTCDVGILTYAVSKHNVVEGGLGDVNSNSTTGAHVYDRDVGDGNGLLGMCVQETAFMEESDTGDNVTLAGAEHVISDTASTVLNIVPSGPGLFRQKTIRSRWQRALQRINKRNEEQLVLAWEEVTKDSRAGRKSVVPDLHEESSISSTVHLSDDECRDFISPFMNTDVPGITDDIASEIKAGYPEFLARLKVGADSLAQWLSIINSFILDLPKSEINSLGKTFFMEGISLHGLTFWTALSSTTKIRTSGKLLRCWKTLIGNHLLKFLSENGMITDAQWLEVGPPVLPEFGIATWQCHNHV